MLSRGALRLPPLLRSSSRLASACCLARPPPPAVLAAPPRARALSSSIGRAAHPPPDKDQRLAVLFPRLGKTKASMEVKKRVLKFSPHMGGSRLKLLARKHARYGTMNSFVADLESRLDRFLWRMNVAPSIFAARFLCGHGHIMVNGRVERSTHRVLNPYDIIEPAPSSRGLVKQMIQRRLDNNSFYLSDQMPSPRNGAAAARRLAARPEKTGRSAYDLDRLAREAPEATGRRLPPAADGGSHALQSAVVPLILALARGHPPLHAELLKARGRLAASVPPPPRRAGGAAPAVTLSWEGGGALPSPLMRLDRVRMRRLMLALLALQPATP